MSKPHTVDFFTYQDMAHRNTKRLVMLFAVAVLGIIVAIYTAVRFAHYYYTPCIKNAECTFHWWDTQTFLLVSILVALFIGILSGIRILSLKSGGGKVARMLGGRSVQMDTKEPKERMLVNVIEEMAIASGVPVPQIYVLDSEIGINAFAAGFTNNDAAVAVTKGCLNNLTRDELQGVIAHEFSHILNGDMRLNIHLIGVLFGIFALSIVGRYILSGTRRSRGKGAGAVVLVAIAILIIGYIGASVGRLIQSAVCRQKEFLADSSAVQFTRNPQGLAGALKKIGGITSGSIINDPQAEQASHLFFSQGIKIRFLSNLLASHPPLDMRIRRLDPSFDGKFTMTDAQVQQVLQREGMTSHLSASQIVSAQPDSVIKSVGRPSAESLELSSSILRMIPQTVHSAASDRDRAEFVIYALLLDKDSAEREKQLEKMKRFLRPEKMANLLALFEEIRSLDPRCRLSTFMLTLHALQTLKKDNFIRISSRVNMLVASDAKVTLFEFVIQWMMENQLIAPRKKGQVVYKSMKPLLADVNVLLRMLAEEGSEGDKQVAGRALDAGKKRIADMAKVKSDVGVECELTYFDIKRALNRLALASYDVRSTIVDACVHCAMYDNKITVREAELLRVVCMALACPLPPFVS